MAYVEHPIEHMDIRSLHLDVSNYRFAADQPSETAALNYLWAEQNVADVAELILRDGYVDNEQPLAVVENGRHIVIEGNRRVSALMALNDPSLAPAHQPEIERLLKRFAIEAANLPQSIRVMVLPDRLAAAPILARLHIGVSKKRWDLDEQAKFVQAQMTDEITIEQLSALLPGIENVPRVVRMGGVRDRLRGTRFPDAALTRYAHGSRLKMSSFEYAYRQSQIQELIGLRFGSEARVERWAETDEELAALERLLRGFKDGELNTRRGLKANTPEFAALLKEMAAAGATSDPEQTGTANGAPTASPDALTGPTSAAETTTDSTAAPAPQQSPAITGGTISSAEQPQPRTDDVVPAQGSDGDKADSADASDGRRGPNDPLLQVNIQLAGIDEPAQPITMRTRLRELRRINVFEFPAAAAMLMRSVLEASVKEHYGRSNGIDVTGELGAVMRRVRDDYRRNGQLTPAINTVMQFSDDAAHRPGTGKWFNTVTHSVNVAVEGKDVQRAWQVVLPLVRFLLHEQHRAPTPADTSA